MSYQFPVVEDPDYPRLRDSVVCPLCERAKGPGLIACWECYSRCGFRHGISDQNKKTLDRKEGLLQAEEEAIFAEDETAEALIKEPIQYGRLLLIGAYMALAAFGSFSCIILLFYYPAFRIWAEVTLFICGLVIFVRRRNIGDGAFFWAFAGGLELVSHFFTQ